MSFLRDVGLDLITLHHLVEHLQPHSVVVTICFQNVQELDPPSLCALSCSDGKRSDKLSL